VLDFDVLSLFVVLHFHLCRIQFFPFFLHRPLLFLLILIPYAYYPTTTVHINQVAAIASLDRNARFNDPGVYGKFMGRAMPIFA